MYLELRTVWIGVAHRIIYNSLNWKLL
jgi:hypothetical protein